jgi:hypothetical protein
MNQNLQCRVFNEKNERLIAVKEAVGEVFIRSSQLIERLNYQFSISLLGTSSRHVSIGNRLFSK